MPANSAIFNLPLIHLSSLGLTPDLVVTEVLGQQDLGFIRSLHTRYPRLPILVASFRDEHWYAPGLLKRERMDI